MPHCHAIFFNHTISRFSMLKEDNLWGLERLHPESIQFCINLKYVNCRILRDNAPKEIGNICFKYSLVLMK